MQKKEAKKKSRTASPRLKNLPLSLSDKNSLRSNRFVAFNALNSIFLHASPTRFFYHPERTNSRCSYDVNYNPDGNAQCSTYNVQCSMSNVQCSMFNAQCSTFNVQCSKLRLSERRAKLAWTLPSVSNLELRSMFNVQCSMFNVQRSQKAAPLSKGSCQLAD